MHMLNLLDIFNFPQAPVAVTYKLPQKSYPEHAHDVDEIVIVTSGEGIHTLNGKQYEARRGDIFYVRAYDWHQFENVRGLHLFNILCRCTERPQETILPKYDYLKNSPKHWKLRLNILQKIEESMVPQLDLQCQTLDDASPCMISLLFTQILTYLWHGRLPQLAVEKTMTPRKMMLDIISYLNDRYSEDHTLSDLARHHSMSERTLNRQFKEYTGLSPMHYLIELRLYKAIELLRKTHIPITELAFKCGFNDSNYFSNAFKKKFGISPRMFHNQYRKNQVGNSQTLIQMPP